MPGVRRIQEFNVQDYRLRYLALAAQHGSMRVAADVLGVAPSSISRQIRQLEEDLKIELIEKGAYKIQLTEAGRLLTEYYDSRSVEHQNLLARLTELRNLRTSTVRLAVCDGFLIPELIAGLAHLCRQATDITLEVNVFSSVEVQNAVLNGSVDVGVFVDIECDVRLRSKLALAQPICLITQPGTPITRRDIVDVSTVAKEKLVLPAMDTLLSEIIHSALRTERVGHNAALISNSVAAILASARSGMGVTLLPEGMALKELREGSLISRRVDSPELCATKLFVVSKTGHRLTGVGLSLLSSVAAVFSNLSGP